jgi:hypothetical protein
MRFLSIGVALLITAVAMAPMPYAAADTRIPAQRVYRVDSVTAVTKGHGRTRAIDIQAKGAVQSGGWQNARLRLLKNDGHTLTLEFMADPPPPDMVVIQALVPVKARALIRTRHPITAVHVLAASNDATQPIPH